MQQLHTVLGLFGNRKTNKLVKPNTSFKLSVRDIEVIEQALRAKAGRRGLAIAEGETSPQLREEIKEIQELVGGIYHQKNWYRPKGKFLSG